MQDVPLLQLPYIKWLIIIGLVLGTIGLILSPIELWEKLTAIGYLMIFVAVGMFVLWIIKRRQNPTHPQYQW